LPFEITLQIITNAGEAAKVGSPPKPETLNNQFLEPTYEHFRIQSS
jgi:hypothetical protein